MPLIQNAKFRGSSKTQISGILENVQLVPGYLSHSGRSTSPRKIGMRHYVPLSLRLSVSLSLSFLSLFSLCLSVSLYLPVDRQQTRSRDSARGSAPFWVFTAGAIQDYPSSASQSTLELPAIRNLSETPTLQVWRLSSEMRIS